MSISTTMMPLGKRLFGAMLPYSDDALRRALDRVHEQWRKACRAHDRLAIYKYLQAVFDLGMVWKKEKAEIARAKRAIRAAGIDLNVIEPFAAIIACTSSRKQVDNKLRSKWTRALLFAAEAKSSAEPLARFIRGHGGLNEAAAEYARRLGRHKAAVR